MKPYLVLITLILLSVSVMACGAVPAGSAANIPAGIKVTVPGGAYTNVDPKTLKQMLDHKDFVLINVHTPYIGEITNTDAFIPYDQIESKTDQLPKDKEAMIVLYCSSGHMSTIAATRLVQLGYTNVWNLEGGMNGWSNAGFSLLKK